MLPLIALSYGTFWLVWLPLSFVVPELVQSWGLEPTPPTLIAGAPVRSALNVVVSVLVAPVAEELAFRGVLLQRWALKWGAGPAMLASSLAFGVAHQDPLGATAFGLVMALLYVRTGGLWVPIACHVLNNALGVAVEATPWGASEPSYTIAEFRQEWYLGAAGLAVALPSLYLLRWHFLPREGWRLPTPAP